MNFSPVSSGGLDSPSPNRVRDLVNQIEKNELDHKVQGQQGAFKQSVSSPQKKEAPIPALNLSGSNVGIALRPQLGKSPNPMSGRFDSQLFTQIELTLDLTVKEDVVKTRDKKKRKSSFSGKTRSGNFNKIKEMLHPSSPEAKASDTPTREKALEEALENILTPRQGRKSADKAPPAGKKKSDFKLYKIGVADKLNRALPEERLGGRYLRLIALTSWLNGKEDEMEERVFTPIKERLKILVDAAKSLIPSEHNKHLMWTGQIQKDLNKLYHSDSVESFLQKCSAITSTRILTIIKRTIGEKWLKAIKHGVQQDALNYFMGAEYKWPMGEAEEFDAEKIKAGDLELSALRSLVHGGTCQVQQITFITPSKDKIKFNDDGRTGLDKQGELDLILRFLKVVNQTGYFVAPMADVQLEEMAKKVQACEPTEVSNLLRGIGVGAKTPAGKLIRARFNTGAGSTYRLVAKKGKIAPRVQIIGPHNFLTTFQLKDHISRWVPLSPEAGREAIQERQVIGSIRSVLKLRWNEDLQNVTGDLRVGLVCDKGTPQKDKDAIKQIWAQHADPDNFLQERLKWPEYQDKPLSPRILEPLKVDQ